MENRRNASVAVGAATEKLKSNTQALDNQHEKYTTNESEMTKFYNALFRYSKNGLVAIRAFSHNTKPCSYKNWKLVNSRQRDEVIEHAVSLSNMAANENAVFCPPIATFNESGKAGEANLCEGLTLSIDIDSGDPKASLDKLTRLIGQPTLVVESGGIIVDESTGELMPKLHAHWRLSAPTDTPQEHEKLKQARELASVFIASDATAAPVSHPFRWAGSWNMKAEPRQCKIQSLDEEMEINLSDAFKALRESDIPNNYNRQGQNTGNTPIDYTKYAKNIIDGVELHDSILRLSAKKASQGLVESDITDELRGLMNLSVAQKDDRWQQRYDDIERTVRTAMRYYKKPINEAHITAMFDELKANQAPDGWMIKPYNVNFSPDLSQDQLALELSQAGFGKDARFIKQWGKWIFWRNNHWVVDDKLMHMTAIRDFTRTKAKELIRWSKNKSEILNDNDAGNLLKNTERHAKGIRQAANIMAIESLARSNSDLIATVDQFDNNPMLLGTPDGTVDLKTGNLIPAEREQYISKLTSVSPAAQGTESPKWNAFLHRIFDGDKELINFLQIAAGYSLTGYTTEHKLFFMYGTGSNGKSVFINTLFDIMGDYSKRASSQTFLNSGNERHPTDLAQLQGARLVVGSELPAGKTWNEAIIKDLTGGDKISARLMRQDFFEYMPQFSLFIAGNHMPSFKGIDEAIRRRLVLIPFTQTIPASERDQSLPDKLKAEWPAILRWAIDGAVLWNKYGLSTPKSVDEASEEYMDDEDTLGAFIEENLNIGTMDKVSNEDMYNRFTNWQKSCGMTTTWTKRGMTQALKERGLVQVKSGTRFWKDVSLYDEPEHYFSPFNVFK